MTFRYFIFDPFDGDVKGTNKEVIANHYAKVDDFFVIDTTTNEMLLPSGERLKLEEIVETGDPE